MELRISESRASHRMPLQGVPLLAGYPGLKPWASMFRHFMAVPALAAFPLVPDADGVVGIPTSTQIV
jgi:hypothetical protein